MVDSFKTKLKQLKQKLTQRNAKRTEGHSRAMFPTIRLKGKGMQPYRMAIWNSHILFFLVIILMMTNIVLGIVLALAYPLKRVEPMLIQAKGKDDVYVTVTPLKPSVAGYDVLLESMVRGYVEKREKIDLIVDANRWIDVREMSKPEIWKVFHSRLLGSKGDYNKRLKDHVTRDVTIRNVSRLDPHIFQIEWDAVDRNFSEVVHVTTWVSILKFVIEPQDVKLEARYTNPLGFFVSGYSVSKKENQE